MGKDDLVDSMFPVDKRLARKMRFPLYCVQSAELVIGSIHHWNKLNCCEYSFGDPTTLVFLGRSRAVFFVGDARILSR